MTQDAPIIGFRQDRIGARLVCLLNVLRLSRKFDMPGIYLWLSQPDGPYPELVDPGDFLAPDFVACHIRVISQAPDLALRRNLRALAPRTGQRQIAAMLAAGERFECDAMSENICLMDESPPTVAAEMREIAAGLQLSDALRRALDKARRIVLRAGRGAPVAIHVRRGDILDGDPWSYSSWASKYVPDEFFRAFIADSTGPVIAFSDTPAAVTHLAQGDPRVLPVASLFETASLSAAERDLLELLLMAGCARVGAPRQSAFSRAAAIVGQCEIVGLPDGLGKDSRFAAHAALLDRVITRQDSFFAPGDLAQSISYATRHATHVRRGSELVDALAARGDLLERFPFLYHELSVTAFEASRKQKARRLAQRGLASPLMRNRDKLPCRQVLLMTEAAGQVDLEAEFLSLALTGRAAEGSVIPGLAHRLLSQDGPATRAAMFSPGLVPLYTRPGAAGEKTLPLWLLRGDWAEMIGSERLRGELLLRPEMGCKLAPACDGLAEIEAALAKGETPAPPTDDVAMRLGFCAMILRLHGRLNRAFALLHWLEATRPGDRLTRKRLADACFTAGNRKAGNRWLDAALQLAPDNPMLRLSAAIRAAEDRQPDRAVKQLETAATLWPTLALTETVRRNRGKYRPA